MTLASWWESGTRVPVHTQTGPAELFVRDDGRGSAVTLLHGYPGSSYDWSAVATSLTTDHRVITPDFLGFGASDKPFPYPYSIREQADFIEQVWSHVGVTSSVVVAHDYATSVAQELLRRGSATVSSVVLLNGGVHPKLHRPTDGQLALLSAEGDVLATLITEEIWTDALAATFGERHPLTPEQAGDLWRAFSKDDGQHLAAALLHYIGDRAVDGEAWVEAMETTAVPIAFIWGPSDPVSGAHMIDEVERRLPEVPITRLDGIGHWPPLEDPGGVTAALAEFLR